MTNTRYFRLQELVFDSFSLEAPVEIEKGALLLDIQTRVVILQLKLNILIDKISEISSVRLKIKCYDDARDEILGFSPYCYTFRDINIFESKSFGDRTPIILDPRVRKASVEIKRVVFVDGEVWQYSGGKITSPQQEPINNLKAELHNQLKRDIETSSPISGDQIKFLPQQHVEYWLCSCGRPNKKDSEKCCRCGITKNWVFKYLTEESIRKNLEKFKEDLRIQEEEYKQQKARLKRKKRQITVTTSIVLISLSTLVILLNFVIIPLVNDSIKYSQAENYYRESDFNNAISLWDSLDDFKNSKEMVNESKYYLALQHLEEGNISDALKLFELLEDYKDSDERVVELKYYLATLNFEEGNINEAIELFELLGDYKDSEEKVELMKEEYEQCSAVEKLDT